MDSKSFFSGSYLIIFLHFSSHPIIKTLDFVKNTGWPINSTIMKVSFFGKYLFTQFFKFSLYAALSGFILHSYNISVCAILLVQMLVNFMKILLKSTFYHCKVLHKIQQTINN